MDDQAVKSSATAVPLKSLEGTLERLTFQNEETGYTVARLIPKGKSYEVTVVGTLTGVQVGESVCLQGVWTTHSKYGRQFEVRAYKVQLPATIEGIRKYLGSGLIKGIGPVNAGRIVDYFGLQTLDVIERKVTRLREVPGIGAKRIASISQAWEQQKQIKALMIFLQGHGVSTSLAVKIYKQYGDTAVDVINRDPYRLAKDIYGVGFKTADKVAQQMGIAPDAPERVQAGLRYALGTFSDNGHCFATWRQLVDAAVALLGVPCEACEAQLRFLIKSEELIAEPGELSDAEDDVSDTVIYLPPFYYAEQGVSNKIRQLQASPRDRLALFKSLEWDKAFSWLDAQMSFRLAAQQKIAVQMALMEKVSILTGGPGTGKSTITGSIIKLLKAKGKSVLLAAPTGRAAKRLSEATGLEAKTIHRLLEFKPTEGFRFLRDQDNPLDADLIIVDEASMMDILLVNHLLKAVEAGSHLLFIGDVDQLPSVGPGNVLRDLIDSESLSVTRLDVIFRQAEDSFIVDNAHRINQGQMPVFPKQARDFFLFRQQDADQAAELIVDIVARRIPEKFGYDAHQAIQVLSPMHRAAVGVVALNGQLQARLNPVVPGKPECPHGSRVFRVGDRVMQIHNNYDKQVFNGDLGNVTFIDLEAQLLWVNFEGVRVAYEFSQLDELVLAYAISIHKSQGAEFPVVVLPLLMQHYMMLQRNLLYTGITRARDMVVLVGNKRAIAIAVQNNKVVHRNTRLAQRLQHPLEIPGATDLYAF